MRLQEVLCFPNDGPFRRFEILNAVKTFNDFFRNGTSINQFQWGEAKRYMPTVLRKGEASIFGPSINHFMGMNMGLMHAETLSERQRRAPAIGSYFVPF